MPEIVAIPATTAAVPDAVVWMPKDSVVAAMPDLNVGANVLFWISSLNLDGFESKMPDESRTTQLELTDIKASTRIAGGCNVRISKSATTAPTAVVIHYE